MSQVATTTPASVRRTRRRAQLAWTLCLAGLPALTAAFAAADQHVSVGAALLLDLCVVMAVAVLGGLAPGLAASLWAFALTNWFLTPPLHTFSVGETQNVVALTVFVSVTVVVSVLVDRAARQTREAIAARAEATSLARAAAAAEVLVQTDALRTALLQAVSHDFRTPLAIIKAAASGLLETGIDFSEEERREMLVDLDGAVDRLDRMVRDLLDMSRLQAGAVELALRPTALEDVVASALAGIRNATDRVEVDVSESLPLVLADPALLERAIANLVSNAVAWSPDDVAVTVVATQRSGAVDLNIVDRGPGVAAHDRERIFRPFERLGDRSHDAGAGLGLAIARGFTVAMGARLDLTETPGGGLTMVLRLPIASGAA